MPRDARSAPTLAEIMRQHPHLNSFGIGVFDAGNKTARQQQADTVEKRDELLDREHVVLLLAEWLRENISVIQTPTQNSYRVKGLIERSQGVCITNGELIAAALIAGYPHKYAGPNMLLGMSQRDLNRIRNTGEGRTIFARFE